MDRAAKCINEEHYHYALALKLDFLERLLDLGLAL